MTEINVTSSAWSSIQYTLARNAKGINTLNKNLADENPLISFNHILKMWKSVIHWIKIKQRNIVCPLCVSHVFKKKLRHKMLWRLQPSQQPPSDSQYRRMSRVFFGRGSIHCFFQKCYCMSHTVIYLDIYIYIYLSKRNIQKQLCKVPRTSEVTWVNKKCTSSNGI